MTVLDLDHYGGGQYAELAAAATLASMVRRGRVILVVTTGAGAAVRLADARNYPGTGFPVHYVFNAAASSDSLILEDNDGTTLRTIPVGQCLEVALEDQSTAAGVWGVGQPRAFTSGGVF